MKVVPIAHATMLISLLAFLSCSSTKKAGAPIIWQVQPIIADGDNSDWSLPYSYVDSKANMEYSFSNDKENLYITVKTSSRMTQMKILNAGMQVWIDLSGKKNKTTAVTYPLQNPEPMKMSRQSMSQSGDKEKQAAQGMKKALAEARDFSLQGFKGCNGAYLISQNNNCGIDVKIGLNSVGELIWEAVVPFRSFYKDAIAKEDLGKTISICFEINALKQSDMASAPGNGGRGGARQLGGRGGGMQGGGGMSGRGGMGGGRPGMGGGNSEDKMQLFEKTTSWEKIRLAYSE